MIKYIQESIKQIPLKMKNKNFYNADPKIKENNINNEYKALKLIIDNDSIHYNFLNMRNRQFDRYLYIKPYNHNIVTINSGNKYINASPINIITDKFFIATQSPLKDTIEDFWTMIEEYSCNMIVMLCNEFEKKIARYWEENDKMNNYSIKLLKQEKKYNYIIREILLTKKNTEIQKNIIQIHFTEWSDDVPENYDGKIFEIFEDIIKLVDKVKGNGPVVVHCKAGVGRTGTFISMYLLYKEIMKQIEEKTALIQFSIFNLVRKLKEMRIFLVHKSSRYNFIYSFVDYILNKYNI